MITSVRLWTRMTIWSLWEALSVGGLWGFHMVSPPAGDETMWNQCTGRKLKQQDTFGQTCLYKVLKKSCSWNQASSSCNLEVLDRMVELFEKLQLKLIVWSFLVYNVKVRFIWQKNGTSNIIYQTRMYFCLVTVSKFASGPWWDCETVGRVLGSSPLANRTKFWCMFAF